MHFICQTLAKFSWFERESVEKEKENLCVVFTNSIKRAHESRKVSCRSRAMTAKKCFAD